MSALIAKRDATSPVCVISLFPPFTISIVLFVLVIILSLCALAAERESLLLLWRDSLHTVVQIALFVHDLMSLRAIVPT
jgi:hypothetical protein